MRESNQSQKSTHRERYKWSVVCKETIIKGRVCFSRRKKKKMDFNNNNKKEEEKRIKEHMIKNRRGETHPHIKQLCRKISNSNTKKRNEKREKEKSKKNSSIEALL